MADSTMSTSGSATTREIASGPNSSSTPRGRSSSPPWLAAAASPRTSQRGRTSRRLLSQQFRAAPGGQGPRPQGTARGGDNVQRAAADTAGGAQDDNRLGTEASRGAADFRMNTKLPVIVRPET